MRWRLAATTRITVVSAKKIRYATTLELQVEGKISDNHDRYYIFLDRTTPFRILADRLFESLYSEYVAFFRNEYGLTVAKLTREK